MEDIIEEPNNDSNEIDNYMDKEIENNIENEGKKENWLRRAWGKWTFKDYILGLIVFTAMAAWGLATAFGGFIGLLCGPFLFFIVGGIGILIYRKIFGKIDEDKKEE